MSEDGNFTEPPTNITKSDEIVAIFEDGPIGIIFNHEGEIIQIRTDSQAADVDRLSNG